MFWCLKSQGWVQKLRTVPSLHRGPTRPTDFLLGTENNYSVKRSQICCPACQHADLILTNNEPHLPTSLARCFAAQDDVSFAHQAGEMAREAKRVWTSRMY